VLGVRKANSDVYEISSTRIEHQGMGSTIVAMHVSGTTGSIEIARIGDSPAGLWTANPQDAGWIRVVDAASKTIWIPMTNVTGSANFGATDCSTLSKAEASAVIPRSAATISLVTADGETTTLGDLLGKRTSNEGWSVRFTFSADVTR
jgi:hypothetical protein